MTLVRPPNVNQPVVDDSGTASRAWYTFFNLIASSLSNAPTSSPPDDDSSASGKVVGLDSISVLGALPGVVTISLAGDQWAPGNTQYYGTSGAGSRGWHNVSDAISVSNLSKSVGTDGVTTLGLQAISDAGGGLLKRFSRDSYGRVSGTSAATTDDLGEGSGNLYFTNARVSTSITSGPGITLSTNPTTGVTTISESSLILPNLTDQTGANLTDQAIAQLTANSTSGTIPVLAKASLSSLPNASTYQFGIVFVTDLTGGGAPCYSDGANWRRFSDNSIAS